MTFPGQHKALASNAHGDECVKEHIRKMASQKTVCKLGERVRKTYLGEVPACYCVWQGCLHT